MRYVLWESMSQYNLFKEKIKMTMRELELFRESCFGHFLDMPSITRSSKIINNLILRTGYFEGVPQSRDKLLIEIGGVPREFTRAHFSEITGLQIDDSYNATTNEYGELLTEPIR